MVVAIGMSVCNHYGVILLLPRSSCYRATRVQGTEGILVWQKERDSVERQLFYKRFATTAGDEIFLLFFSDEIFLFFLQHTVALNTKLPPSGMHPCVVLDLLDY